MQLLWWPAGIYLQCLIAFADRGILENFQASMQSG